MRKKRVYLVTGIGIVVVTAFYLLARTGVSVTVTTAGLPAQATGQIAEARVQVWQADSLVASRLTDESGAADFRLRPGIYEIVVMRDGFSTAILDQQSVARFRRSEIPVVLQAPPGMAATELSQSVDTTATLRKARPEDLWRVWTDERTGMPHLVTGSAVTLARTPRDPQAAAQASRTTLLHYIEENRQANPAFKNLDSESLRPVAARRIDSGWVVLLQQLVATPFASEPVPVFGSEASSVIEGRRLVQFGLSLFPPVAIDSTRAPRPLRLLLPALRKYEAVQEVDTTSVQLVAFPLPGQTDSTAYEFRLAYQFFASRDAVLPLNQMAVWHYVVDAQTGRALFREKLAAAGTAGRIRVAVYEQSPDEGETVLRNLEGGLIGNDSLRFWEVGPDGRFEVPEEIATERLEIALAANGLSVFKAGSPRQPVFYFKAPKLPPEDVYRKSLADSNVSVEALENGRHALALNEVVPQFNTFYHINRARKYIEKMHLPNAVLQTLEVFIDENVKNAYYVGGQNYANPKLVFGRYQSPLGLRSDVIYHEYGHAVVDYLTRFEAATPRMLATHGELGAMHEAWADYFACAINGDPEIRVVSPDAPGAKTWNRNLINDLQYGTDFQRSAVPEANNHANSQILSAALWQLRTALQDRYDAERGAEIADLLVLRAVQLRPVATTFEQFGLALLQVDSDGRLARGSPHASEVRQAFAAHGIDLPAFELTPPDITRFTLSTRPETSGDHLEAGRQVEVRANITERGSGLDRRQLRLTVNGETVPPDRLNLRSHKDVTTLRYVLNGGNPVRQDAFGDSVIVELAVADSTGNRNQALLRKAILDKIKPGYRLTDCDFDWDYVYVVGEVTDQGSGIDPESFKLVVNGQRISQYQINRINDYHYRVSIRYPFKVQMYEVYGEVADRAGNVQSKHQPSTSCLTPCTTVLSVVLGMLLMRRRRPAVSEEGDRDELV